MNFLRKAWMGQERLWKVWWLIGVPLALSNSLIIGLADILRWPDAALLAVGIVQLSAYGAWCKMALACAMNVDRKVWGILARIAVVLSTIKVISLLAAMPWLLAS